jgi:hypothetical protein
MTNVLCRDFTPAGPELLPAHTWVNPRLAEICAYRWSADDREQTPLVHFESTNPTWVQCAPGGCACEVNDCAADYPGLTLTPGERRRIAVVLPEARGLDPVMLFDELVQNREVGFGYLKEGEACLRDQATDAAGSVLMFELIDLLYTIPSIVYFAAFRVELDKATGEMFMTRTEGPIAVCAREGD